MALSFVETLTAERQSRSNQDYFATRASQCFSATTGNTWVDSWVVSAPSIESPSGQPPVNDIEVKSRMRTSDALSNHVYLSRIETEHGLRQLLKSHHNAAFKAFFIRQRNSVSRLGISWQLFDALCQSCGVSTKIRDYVMCFGLQNGESEITPPAMHYHLSRWQHLQQPTTLECIYVLRFVEPNNRTYGNPWSIRQSGIYSHFNRETGTVVWLFISLSSTAEGELQRWRTEVLNLQDVEPFDVHYMLFDIAVSGWRRYIVYLAEEVRQQADRAVVADFEADGVVVTRLEERQYLKQIEDNVTDLLSALEFMLENIEIVMRCYRAFTERSLFDESSDKVSADAIPKAFEDRRRDLLRFVSQVQALRRKVDSASSLVSNILELNNGNALKALALESRVENANMALLTRKSVQDAATVKVLTIVTLVYLPVTVVTNFFSTSFVNATESSSGRLHLSVIPQVWILFAVSVPLTVATIYVWWIFAQKEIRGTFPGRWKRVSKRPKPVSQDTNRPAGATTIDLRSLT